MIRARVFYGVQSILLVLLLCLIGGLLRIAPALGEDAATAPAVATRPSAATEPQGAVAPPPLLSPPPPISGHGSDQGDEPDDVKQFTIVINKRSLFDNLRAAYMILAAQAADRALLSREIADARKAYWAAYPNGANLNELAAAYGDALNRKASAYLVQHIQMAVMDDGKFDMSGAAALTARINHATGEIDNGYSVAVRDAFNAWTKAVGVIPNPRTDKTGIAEGKLSRAMPQFEKFCQAEDMDEFLSYSPTSPARSADPATFFLSAAIRSGRCDTFAQARKLYQDLIPYIGEPVIHEAMRRMRADTTKNLRLAEALQASAAQSKDDHVLLLAILQQPFQGPLFSLQLAAQERDRLVAELGEPKVLAAAAALRLPQFNAQFAVRRFYHALGATPSGHRSFPPVYTLFTFNSLDSMPWSCMARGSTGNALIGLRVQVPGVVPEILRAQYNATHPPTKLLPPDWSDPRNPKPFKLPPPSAESARTGMEIVRLDCDTQQLTVLATIDAKSLGDTFAKPAQPRPGSLVVAGGWVYCTDAVNGAAFRVREDGTGLARLPLPQKPEERPMFFAVDPAGQLLGGTLHSIFSMAPDGSKVTTLASDPVNWIIAGDVAADGTVYFQKRHAYTEHERPGGAQYDLNVYFDMYPELWQIDPRTGKASGQPVKLPKRREYSLTPVMVARDGRIIGPLEEGFFEYAPSTGIVFRTGNLQFSPLGRPVECNGRVFCISYPTSPVPIDRKTQSDVISCDIGTDPKRNIFLLESTVGTRPCTGLIAFDAQTLVGACAGGNEADGGCIYALDAADRVFGTGGKK